MVIVMLPDATRDDVEAIIGRVEAAGGQAFVSRGVRRMVIGVVGEAERSLANHLGTMPGVARISRISSGFKLISREPAAERSVVQVGGVPIGPATVTLVAGPCAVESPEQTLAAAQMGQRAGATLLRGGAFTPRVSPYAFSGLGRRGLEILAEVRAETGLPVITEVVGIPDVDLVAEYADMLQIGPRNMQNFPLLQAVGAVGKPVLLNRNANATIEEWLMAAEYVAKRGNLGIVLCEPGIRTFDTATRNTLDISAVPVVQRLSHLPVLVDPSNSTGRRDLVLPLARAAIVAGADGLVVDVHPRPEEALCDGKQALVAEDLRQLASTMEDLTSYMGRSILAHRRRRAS